MNQQEIMLLKSKFIPLLSILYLFGCSSDNVNLKFDTILGNAQGTTYSIILVGEKEKITKFQIDSILQGFDRAVSNYIPNSLVSKFNSSKDTISFIDSSGYFKNCLIKSQFVYDRSDGAFDPSVFPLVDAWGFFDNRKSPLTKSSADSILSFVSYQKDKLFHYEFINERISFTKVDPRFKLDFNAIAQGYAVDVLANFIRKKGYTNFYVELGGEVFVSGINRENENWKIGIDTPTNTSKQRVISEILSVSNEAIATSGNYRKFYEYKGKKYAHTIDPNTGLQVTHNLLSATVIASDCATADAFATAFMVLGKYKTLKFLEQNPDLKLAIYLIYDENGETKSYSSHVSKIAAQ